MNIILLSEKDLQHDGSFLLTDKRAAHIFSILKAAVGDTLEIGLINKKIGTAKVAEVSENKVILIDHILQSPKRRSQIIDVIFALPRPQTVKKILFTAGMMGVRNLFFIRANRVEKSYFHSPLLEKENYTRYLIEGMQQGKNVFMPEVSIHEKFKLFIEDYLPDIYKSCKESPVKLLPEQSSPVALDKVLNRNDKHILFAIGPEGGWVDFELALMETAGFNRFHLGDWTLRVEHALTASLAQTALIFQN